MEKGSDISKSVALVLIILTVMISAASTWVLITKSMVSDSESSINSVLVQLHILKGPIFEPAQTDTNSGDVGLFIATGNGG